MTALEKLLENIEARADVDPDIAIEIYPATACALVEIIREAVGAMKNRCYCVELDSRLCWVCVSKDLINARIEKLAEGVV